MSKEGISPAAKRQTISLTKFGIAFFIPIINPREDFQAGDGDGMRMRVAFLFQLGVVLLLAGCTTTEPPPAVEDADVLLYLEPELRPEILQFPEYLFMEDFEIDQHGGVPETTLTAGGLKTKLDLKTVRQRFEGLLVSKGWKINQSEELEQSFRLMASMKGEAVEIRAVQGTGDTQVFILYRPAATQQ